MRNSLINICLFSYLSWGSLAVASSVVSLPVPSGPIVAKSSGNILLEPLVHETPYMVTCTVSSTAKAPLNISLVPRLAPKGGFGVTTLDDKPFDKNMTALHQGNNMLSFMASIADGKTEHPNAIVLNNLDDQATFTVTACEAKPVSGVTTAQNRMTGGYFYVTNYLPYFLDITVGNFFPTSYCIYPNIKQYIRTTTPYQDIDVVAVHY